MAKQHSVVPDSFMSAATKIGFTTQDNNIFLLPWRHSHEIENKDDILSCGSHWCN